MVYWHVSDSGHDDAGGDHNHEMVQAKPPHPWRFILQFTDCDGRAGSPFQIHHLYPDTSIFFYLSLSLSLALALGLSHYSLNPDP